MAAESEETISRRGAGRESGGGLCLHMKLMTPAQSEGDRVQS